MFTKGSPVTNRPIRYGHNQEEPTYLYVLACAGHTKIGIAANVPDRIKHLQYASPLKIDLLVQRLFLSRRDARAAERALHEQYDHTRTWGEWFNLEAELIAAEVSALYQDVVLPEPEPGISNAERLMALKLEEERQRAIMLEEDLASAERLRPMYETLAL